MRLSKALDIHMARMRTFTRSHRARDRASAKTTTRHRRSITLKTLYAREDSLQRARLTVLPILVDATRPMPGAVDFTRAAEAAEHATSALAPHTTFDSDVVLSSAAIEGDVPKPILHDLLASDGGGRDFVAWHVCLSAGLVDLCRAATRIAATCGPNVIDDGAAIEEFARASLP